jgi:hypothetical protein
MTHLKACFLPGQAKDLSAPRRIRSQFCDQIPFIKVRTLFSETAAVNSRNVKRTLQPVSYGIKIYQQESMKA